MTEEIFPIVDENGRVVGKATRKECHSGSRLLHPVVHLHVFDRQGRLYLQKRAHSKLIQPDKWDTAVGGHVDYGETAMQALRRETREELGLLSFVPVELFRYVFESDVERELVNAFKTVTDCEAFDFDTTEVADGRFWTLDEIRRSMGQGVLTPNFEQEFVKLEEALRL